MYVVGGGFGSFISFFGGGRVGPHSWPSALVIDHRQESVTRVVRFLRLMNLH